MSISWNKLIDDKYWTVQLIAATLGGQNIDLSVNSIIVDTGTSFLLMPTCIIYNQTLIIYL